MRLSDSLRRQVVERAGSRCEYCGLSQELQEAVFHIDHVQPVSLGGPTELPNLALACVSCSLRKSARVNAIDPMTRDDAPLFNPRQELWNLHFRWVGCEISGITATGRATVSALVMNRAIAVGIRLEALRQGRHPPPKQL